MLFRLGLILLTSVLSGATQAETVRVGCKRFTENYLLAEIVSQYLEEQGYRVERRFGLGGTMVAFQALVESKIDMYPEYTGTVDEILKLDSDQAEHRERFLAEQSLVASPSLGFENSYAIATTQELAQKYQVYDLADLSKVPKWRGVLSHEFQARRDGWPLIQAAFRLQQRIQSLEVPLTYEALRQGQAEFAEAYTTEPLLDRYRFQVLSDNEGVLPSYEALLLIRQERSELLIAALKPLWGSLSTQVMRDLNQQAASGQSFASVATSYLEAQGLKKGQSLKPKWLKSAGPLGRQTLTHLALTLCAVLAATLIGVPLGLLCSRHRRLATLMLGLVSLLQTIPSIALLVFMIPILGIGVQPALLALLIYSLLPIVQNTYTGVRSIDPKLVLAARGIGLRPEEILVKVVIPLASPTILAGIRTATILSLGTATLAAFIGAGGLGEPIVTGLALNDTGMVLRGAVPAALLAVLIDRLFQMFSIRQNQITGLSRD